MEKAVEVAFNGFVLSRTTNYHLRLTDNLLHNAVNVDFGLDSPLPEPAVKVHPVDENFAAHDAGGQRVYRGVNMVSQRPNGERAIGRGLAQFHPFAPTLAILHHDTNSYLDPAIWLYRAILEGPYLASHFAPASQRWPLPKLARDVLAE